MTQPDPATLSFEAALDALDKILRELEDGTTGLEESLARYERGVALVKSCYKQLQEAELKIRTLTTVGDDGKPVFEPFIHTPTARLGPSQRTPRSGKQPDGDTE